MPDLTNIPTGWLLASDGKSISREIVFRNFIKAVEAINTLKDLAEQQNHHPDLHLTQYKKLKIVLSTHDAGAITENDIKLAGLINAMGLENKNV